MQRYQFQNQWRSPAVLLAVLCAVPLSRDLCGTASAQSMQRAATDAFGTRIGDESVGLYSEGQVRGFSLQEAGNYRIENAYFVRGARLLSDSVSAGATVRVGPNALGFDFPSPSGVVQYSLLGASGERRAWQLGFADVLESNLVPYMRGFWTQDFSSGNSVSTGFVAFPNRRSSDGGKGSVYTLGMVARWQPVEALRITALADFADWTRDADQLFALNEGDKAPRIPWFSYLGQTWNRSHTKDRNLGLIARYEGIEYWTLSASSIVSQTDVPVYGFSLFSLDTSGNASARAVINKGRKVIGRGHELSALRTFATEKTRSQLNLSTRMRRSDFQNPSSESFMTPSFSVFSDVPQIAKPDFLEPSGFARSSTDQDELGLGYQWRHQNQVALNIGLRAIRTRLSNSPLNAARSERRDQDLLYNAAIVIPINSHLTTFATTTRGLEEAGFAPANASNRFSALAPVQSRQTELGLKWQVAKNISAILTGFELSKADAGLGTDNRFDYIGVVLNRGVEASLAGAINDQWNVVAGAMHMTPKLSGENVTRGLIGDQPVGRSAELGLLSLSYASKSGAWGADASLNFFGRRPANAANTRFTGGNSTLNIGLRYPFKWGDTPAQWRLRVFNVGNHYAWVATPNSLQVFSAPRRLDLQLILGE
jgi:iron complex outermembrane recepter protein